MISTVEKKMERKRGGQGRLTQRSHSSKNLMRGLEPCWMTDGERVFQAVAASRTKALPPQWGCVWNVRETAR